MAATAMNLDSVRLDAYPNIDRSVALRKYFELPDHIMPLCVVAIGYPDEEKNQRDLFFEDKVIFAD